LHPYREKISEALYSLREIGMDGNMTDPADDIKARLDADPVPEFSPKPIVKIDVLQILKLLMGLLRRWI